MVVFNFWVSVLFYKLELKEDIIEKESNLFDNMAQNDETTIIPNNFGNSSTEFGSFLKKQSRAGCGKLKYHNCMNIDKYFYNY